MFLQTMVLVLIIGLPAATTLVLSIFPKRLARAAKWLAGAAAALSLVGGFALIPVLRHGLVPTLTVAWLPTAHIDLILHLDWLTLPFLITEAGVTLVAVVYAWGSESTIEHASHFYALLMLFAVGMSGTTLADDMVLFYTCWELMLIASCALILFWGHAMPDGPSLRAVTLKYFIFTHIGSLLVLVALIILYDATGSDHFSALQGMHLAPAMVTTTTVLFLIGFCVKMAIFPLHLWLPDAHTVAPMPVTIMLAAAMLSMGTYGILRFPMRMFSRTQLLPFAVPMMVAGIISEIYGALMALAERDIKRIIAYSSVSQMGYILFGLGTLTYNGIAGATLHVIYHAIVKALLFMIVGLIVYATGKRNIEDVEGLGSSMPVTAACAGIGVLAIAGMPPLCIFDSEWLIFAGGFETPHIALAVLALFGSLLTVVYALWFAGRIFLGTPSEKHPKTTFPLAMLAPTVLLAVLAVIEGLFPLPLFDWVAHELTLLLGGTW